MGGRKGLAAKPIEQTELRLVYSRDSSGGPPLPERARAYPEFRYMGSKHRLLSWLHGVLSGLDFETAVDPFLGSGCVAYLMKSMGKRVIGSDFLNFPTVIAKALVENNHCELDGPAMKRLLQPLRKRSQFIERTFEGIFFTRADLQFLDRVCSNVERLDNEYRKFVKRFTFTGARGKTAKCDFAVPSKSNPQIVIEAKGYGATGSKMTDVLGDIEKIIDAKRSDSAFLFFTRIYTSAMGEQFKNDLSQLKAEYGL